MVRIKNKLEKQKIELTLSASLQFSSLLRHVAEEVFEYVGFTIEWTSRLKLVVDELFMNANRYGSKKEVGKIYVTFTFNTEEIDFIIEDEGLGEKKVSAEELKILMEKNTREVADLTKTCGRGLALISTLWTDELKIENSSRGGVSVAFKKLVDRQNMPPAPPIHHNDSATSKIVIMEQEVTHKAMIKNGVTKVVSVEGEIYSDNINEKIKPIVSALVAMPENGVLVLDCSKLDYINSTFIGHLAGWHNDLSNKNGQLVLKNVKKSVNETLELVGLSRVIYIENQTNQ